MCPLSIPTVSADMTQDEEPVAPVSNIRTDEGCGVWETLILPKAPPLYRPYSLIDEDAGVLSGSAKDARNRSKERKKPKEKTEGKTTRSPDLFSSLSSLNLSSQILTEDEGTEASNGKKQLSHGN